MTSLKGDIINRVRRLPKPTNAAEAMQPVFEAVSNGMHAIEDYLAAGGTKSGSIDVHITLAKVPQDVTVIVSDTGIGLDGERFAAFITTDTDFRSNRGGKGVGRLLWLDAFQKVHVSSTYIEEGRLMRRSFDFVLAKSDQFQNETIETLAKGSAPTGTIVTFSGLRGTAYERRFPSQAAAIIRHFGSHFLAEFILGSSSHVSLTIGDHHAAFPADIQDLLLEERGVSEKDTEEFGRLRIAHFVFRAAASAGFDGNHQLHLIANRRTVMTRKIDGLLGLGRFGDSRKAVYHGCVSAEFLDERVNQERTHFNFDEEVAENIAKVCAQVAMRDALPTEIAEYDSNRLVTMEGFLSD